MSRKSILGIFAIIGLIIVTALSLFLSNKSNLSQRNTINSKASETANCSSEVCLTVSSTEIGKTSNNILGNGLPQFLGNSWLYDAESYKTLYRAVNSGLNRIFLGYDFDRIAGKTEWFSWPGSKVLAVQNGKIYLQKNVNDTADNWVYQSIHASKFTPGKTYRVSFEYQTNNLQKKPGTDYDHYRIAFAALGNIDTADNGTALGSFQFPLGTQSGTGSFEFTYNPAANTEPLWVRINFWLYSPGEISVDNISVAAIDTPSNNLVKDPSLNSSRAGSVITPEEIDASLNFVKSINQEPVFTLLSAHGLILNPPDFNESTVDVTQFFNYVLQHPKVAEYTNKNLDIVRYVNNEKGYNIKYFEFGNEPELWWFNAGGNYENVKSRFKLYGRLYAMFAKKAKAIDPNIKLGVALHALGEQYKPSIDGILEGIKEHEQLNPNDATTVPVPFPDYYAPHAGYQLRGWSPHVCSNNDKKTCINKLLSYIGYDGSVAACNGTTLTGDTETIPYIEAYFKCVNNYLQTKNITSPVHIATEWAPSGSSQLPYYYFGTALWTADMIGRLARTGILGANYNGGLLQGTPAYPIFALYGKFIGPDTSILSSSTSADEKASAYVFKKPSSSKLYAVITNRNLADGMTNTNIQFPAEYQSMKVKQIAVTCQGVECLYNTDIYLNGTRVQPAQDTNKVVSVLNSVQPTELTFNSNNFNISMPNHSVLFWEIEPTIQISPTPGNSELLLSRNASVRVSTNLSANPGSFVTDGLPSTSWNAGNIAPQWIELDLGSIKTVSRIKMLVNQSPTGNTTHIIYAGSSPTPQTQVKTFSGNTKISDSLETTFNPALTNVRYIRIHTTQSPSWISWSEIDVYGSNNPTSTIPTIISTIAPTVIPTRQPTAIYTPTKTPTSQACLAVGNFCVTSTQCCSKNCIANRCR